MKPVVLLAVLLLLPKPAPANEDLNNTDVIKEYVLDSNTVYNIPVGNAPTTIAFPGPLSSIDGANVSSDPANKAPVLLSHVNGRYFFSIRAAQPKAQAALNIVYKDQTYAFNFYNREGSIPYRTVRLIERKESSPDRQNATDRPQELRKLTPTALISLLDRAKSYHVVGQAHPASVDDVEWRSPESAVTEYRDFNVAIEELFRFRDYDTIVFKVRFRNKIGDDIFYQPQTVAVRVAQNVYYPSIADASGIIPAQSDSAAYIAITGKPNGERADLSLKNAFQIIVSRITDPTKILIP